MADKSIGFIETFGLAACVAAADAAVKSANVKLLGYEYAKGDGMCTVKVEGNVGACKAAIEAGRRAAEAVNGSLSGTKSVRLIARPATGMRELMVDNRETVGGDIALAEGYRPKGDAKKPVLVKNWKPKEEPKEETPSEEAPEPPVVEDLKEETSEAEKKTEIVDPEPEIQPEVTESVVAPETEEPVPVVSPEEVPEVEEAPTEEPAPAEEAPAEEPAPAEEAPAEEPAPAEEAPAEEPAPAEEAPAEEPAPVEEVPVEEASPEKSETEEAPKKTTSTGNRRSGRSRKKKNTDKK